MDGANYRYIINYLYYVRNLEPIHKDIKQFNKDTVKITAVVAVDRGRGEKLQQVTIY